MANGKPQILEHNAADIAPDFDTLAGREWLTVNGIGGYGSNTVAGVPTRRYHALLVAALGPQRMALLSRLDETVSLRGEHFNLSNYRYHDNTVYPDGWRYIADFAPWPVPTWTYRLPTRVARGGEIVLIKRVYLARNKNTVYVTYTLREPTDAAHPGITGDSMGAVTLMLAPMVCWKSYHGEMRPWSGFPVESHPVVGGWALRATPDAPLLRMLAQGAGWTKADWWNEGILHQREQERGQDALESLYCPALATLTLRMGQTAAIIGTLEESTPDDPTLAFAEILNHQRTLLSQAEVRDDDETHKALVLNSDQFLVRTGTGGRATVLAGYPWFTDWGRDACIALPGLCLATKRFAVAREILQSFSGYISEGMIPNRFPDANNQPEYNTVDATLWFVHACARYCAVTQDKTFQRVMLPWVENIIVAYKRGTRYGIHMEADGLITAGEVGTQLTWMDAKVGDWVVTPRIGKPVEVNALWINALRVAQEWGATGDDYAALADKAAQSFRDQFVRPDGQGLYDFIAPDGAPNAQIRPNQILATALPTTPLTDEQIRVVLDTVTAHLLTPCGLRSLAPSDPAYQGHYGGDQRRRDGAYHQGTVWAWLIGAYVDTYRRVHGADADVRGILVGVLANLPEYGVGGIAEIFEGDTPHRPDGCPWQAWSVGEVLRVLRGV